MNPFHPKYRFYWFLLFWALVGLGVSYLLRPDLPPPAGTDAAQYKPVNLPVYPDMQAVNQRFEYLKQKGIYHPLRNKAEKDAPPPPPIPEEKQKPRTKWSLRGVVAISQKPYAIIQVNGRSKWYATGDELPNGEVVEEILADRISILEEGESRFIKLYK